MINKIFRRFFTVLLCCLTAYSVFSQPKIVKQYSKKNGLCGQSLKLYSDKTYIYEYGCEGRSNVNFGKWAKEKKQVILYLADTANFNTIVEIKEERVQSTDSALTIKVIDKFNRPVKNFVMVFIPKSYGTDNRIPSEEQFIFINKYSNEIEFLAGNTTDENGNLFAQVRMPYNILVIFPTQKQMLSYSNPYNNLLTIKLNLSKDAFLYPDVKWFERDSVEFKGQIFQFRKAK